MENKSHVLAAGFFTLILGVGIVVAALWFSGDTAEMREYLLVSHYPVSGLNAQAPVRYRGVTVGKVMDIRFDPADPHTILVQVSVQKGTPLTRGTYATLGSQGVTGLAYVILDDEGQMTDPLPDGGPQLARIEVKPSFLDTVSASGEEMLENFNRVARRVNALLDEENQKQLISTLRNLEQASTKVASAAAALEPALKGLPALELDSAALLRRADSLLVSLNQRVDAFERAAKSAEQLSVRATALSDAMLNESVPRVNGLLEDVQRSTRGMERLLHDINEQPRSLIFGKSPQPPGPGEQGFAMPRRVP